jgi:tetratricopeptide (TPR) repeat protein
VKDAAGTKLISRTIVVKESDDAGDRSVERLSARISALILDRQFDCASALIEEAQKIIGSHNKHRFIALSAVLQKETGNLEEGIDLMRQALEEAPNWLPHLARLADFLMDAECWLDANTALDELISRSEGTNDQYFLDDARFRKIFCLKALGCHEQIMQQKARITPGATAFIGTKCYRIDDL